MASWKRSLCDGEVHDCLRAYFTPCCVFGQTRYRLERIDSNDNPLDLDGYKTSNAACWDWFFFALPLGISCSVFTSSEIGRIRELYGIKGSRKEDVATAVFCPCCSVLRNELEVRTREEEKWNDKHGVVEEPYTPEKPMSSPLPPGYSLPGKENRAPRKDSLPSASGSMLGTESGLRQSSLKSSTREGAKDHNAAGKTPNAATAASSRSNNSCLSLNSSGNGGPVTCTVIEPRNRGQLTPVLERLSEDTMSTAKRSRICASPPPQGENIPLGSIQEGTPPGSQGDKSPSASSPLLSRPTSPRKSVDRPGTPIPPEGPMSPTLSAWSGRSGRSYHRVPLVPVSGAVPSPVEELAEGQTPAETGPTPAAKLYQGQEPIVAVPTARRPSHDLSSDKLVEGSDPKDTASHVVVQGWLNDVGSPIRRKPIDVSTHDHALPEVRVRTARTSKESIMSNATLTPAAFTPMPEDHADKTPTTADTHDTAAQTVPDAEVVKPAVQPTTFAALGTTIAGAIKSLMPAAISSTTTLENNALPLTQSATTTAVDQGEEVARRSQDKDDAAAETVRDPETANHADQQPAHTATSDEAAKENIHANVLAQKTSEPRLRVSSAAAQRPSPQVPPTPAPPGTYPPTPATDVAVQPPPVPAADPGPFVSFRAKQLLGRYLTRDAPKVGPDRTPAWPVRGGRGGAVRGNSLGDDERVWRRPEPPGLRRGSGSSRRRAQGTE